MLTQQDLINHMPHHDIKISAYLITLNEAAHIDEVLTSLHGADEIVLVDSGSTDATLAIATQHGARIIHHPWQGFAKQKAFALSQCTHEWVINLDGDEILPEEAIDKIKQAIYEDPGHCYAIRRNDHFMRISMHRGRMKYFRKIYPKSKSKWRETDLVHEHIDIELPTKKLPLVIKHYGHDSTEILVAKKNSYSSLKAKQRHLSGRHFSPLRLLIIFPVMFLKFYLFRRLFLCGWRGFIKANIEAGYFFLTEAKLHEIEAKQKHGITTDSTQK